MSANSLLEVSTVHAEKNLEVGQVRVWCASPWSSSRWFHVILGLRSKVSVSPGTAMPGGCSLYPPTSVSASLIPTCCLPASSVLVRVSIYRNNANALVRGAPSSQVPARESSERPGKWDPPRFLLAPQVEPSPVLPSLVGQEQKKQA